MSKKVKIFCPVIQTSDDEVLQIVKPGIINSDKCDYTLSSFLGSRIIENPEFAAKFKEDGEFYLGGHKNLPRLGSFGQLKERLLIPYEEDDIDVVLIHGSGNPEKFKKLADHYKHLPIINVDYKDVKIEKMWTEIIDRDNVFNFKRSMVHLYPDKPGHVHKYQYPVHHAPFCVREDIHEQQTKLYRKNFRSREYDVACFFPLHKTIREMFINGKRNVALKSNTRARAYVSAVVDSISDINTWIGYTTTKKGSPQGKGRRGHEISTPGSAQYKYCDISTNSKIIVTACPSLYEGDYRLMEAMTSGALVMHNKMVLPPRGLIDGEHWVVYDNADDLHEKVQYYNKHTNKAQQIARNGRNFVLNNHRPHHRIEEWLKTANIL